MASGELVGALRVNPLAGPSIAEIGYYVHSDRHRRSYATEATRIATDATLKHLDEIQHVEIRMDVANEPSAGVAAAARFVFDREIDRPIVAPAHTGRAQLWVMDRPDRVPGLRHADVLADDQQVCGARPGKAWAQGQPRPRSARLWPICGSACLGCGLSGVGLRQLVGISMRISTRRFFIRPSTVALEVIGNSSPRPIAVIRVGSMPCSTIRYSRTVAARRSLRSWL